MSSMLSRPAVAAIIAGAALFSANGAVAGTVFDVTYQAEVPGEQSATGLSTTATFTTMGVENFNELAPGYYNSITTDFGTAGAGDGGITGTYSEGPGNSTGVHILRADKYGGAGGTGDYIVASKNTAYTLTLTTSIARGVNYFGYWLSALDKGNYVSFYGSNGKLLFTFDPQDVLNALPKATASQYYGNPNARFLVD
jgi:hypothetical protein